MEETDMLAVIFEVRPNKDQFDEYLDIAAALRPELDKIDGFISIDESLLEQVNRLADELNLVNWWGQRHLHFCK